MSPTRPPTLKTVAIIGKYLAAGIALSLSEIAEFLDQRGMRVIFESETARNMGLEGVTAMAPDEIGEHAYVIELFAAHENAYAIVMAVHVFALAAIVAQRVSGGEGVFYRYFKH